MTNQTIINTRPKNLQQQSSQRFKEAGYDVVELPCIELIESSESDIKDQLGSIKVNDVVIFTSQFAVQFTFKVFAGFKLSDSNTVIAVGKKTSEVLEQNSSVSIWVPEKQNSEGVIELLKGFKKPKNIILITAAEGREEIQNYAKQNNIHLQQINVYKRTVPEINKEILAILDDLSDFQTLATSVTTLNNLKTLLPERLWNKIQNNKLICASERIKNKAIELGFVKVLNVGTANIEQLIVTLNKANT